MSIARISTPSIHRPQKPATMPMVEPMTAAVTAAIRPTARLTRVPQTMRESMSRPSWSAPKGCPALSTGASRPGRSVAFGIGQGEQRCSERYQRDCGQDHAADDGQIVAAEA